MKKIIFIITVLPILAFAQSIDQNYTLVKTYKVPTTTAVSALDNNMVNTQITYYDGLGRPIQNIAYKQSNADNDIITPITYDPFGRQTKEYLPYSQTSNNLYYNNAAQTEVLSYYATGSNGTEATNNPFSEKELEMSPLDRVLKQAAPGNAWALNQGKEIEIQYLSNTTTDQVRKFIVNTTWYNPNKIYNIDITSSGYYEENQLYKTITKDENHENGLNHTTEEFKNKQGQIILKRTYNQSIKHDTYYAYDIYGNLTYVIPPLANGSTSGSNLSGLCYQYKYDNKNRLVEKKLPGKDWEYIVYNTQNQVIATAPVFNPWGLNNSTQKGWLITKYDALGRAIYTGYYTGRTTTSASRALYQTEQDSLYSGWYESITTNDNVEGVTLGYSNKVLPTNNYKILTINYYDGYTHPFAPTTPLPSIEGQPTVANVKGLPTGSWVRVLDNNSNTNAEVSYILYDQKFRPVRTHTTNYMGGYTQTNNALDWAGKTLYTVTKHKYNTTATEMTVKDMFTYTPQDLIDTHTHQINQLPVQLLAKNTYDPLGQLITKNVGGQDVTGSTFLQKVDYAYNIRGWLKSMNNTNDIITENDLFSFSINYQDPQNATPLYNGNIAETYWRTASDNILRSYHYQYDDLNRLTNANYQKTNSSNPVNSYWENLTYDKNGNILNLKRNGDLDANDFTINVDDLTYTYHTTNKNRLVKVFDATNHPHGFKDDGNGIEDLVDDYTYDGMGNMTKDDNKGITTITYNHLNLPVTINFSGTAQSISYIYNALGEKVKKTVNNGVPLYQITHTDYLQDFVYTNTKLSFFPHKEGYVNAVYGKTSVIGGFSYVFNYTDHLGNIRLSYTWVNNALQIMEENHYYPFGLKHSKYNSNAYEFVEIENGDDYYIGIDPVTPGVRKVYQYKFQGQERQDELGLNWDSFKWRNYDYAIGRFMSIDPLTEEYNTWSPYTFSGNRVIDARELEGLEPYSVHATEEAAAQNWGEHYNGASVLRGIEMGSTIFTQTITLPSLSPLISTPITLTVFSYNDAALGTADTTAVNSTIPTGATATADIHAHGEFLAGYDNNIFSGLHPTDNKLSTTGDIGDNNSNGLNGYVTTPNGSLQKYEPSTGTVTTVSTNLQSDPKDPTRLNTNAPVDNLPPSP